MSDPWTSWPNAFREAFCAHRIFSAFGIPYSDIYVMPRALNPTTLETEMSVMAKQDGRAFIITVGVSGIPEAEFRERWSAAAADVKHMSTEDFNRMTDATNLRPRAVDIFATLQARGFEGVTRPL